MNAAKKPSSCVRRASAVIRASSRISGRTGRSGLFVFVNHNCKFAHEKKPVIRTKKSNQIKFVPPKSIWCGPVYKPQPRLRQEDIPSEDSDEHPPTSHPQLKPVAKMSWPTNLMLRFQIGTSLFRKTATTERAAPTVGGSGRSGPTPSPGRQGGPRPGQPRDVLREGGRQARRAQQPVGEGRPGQAGPATAHWPGH